QDATGITVRGGVGLSTGQSGVTTLFRGQGQFSGSCNAFDFAESIKETFETVPQVLHTLSEAVLQNLPILLVCSADPVLCDIYKHFQALANLTIQMKYARCQQIQQALADIGTQIHGGEQAKCLAVMQQNGLSLGKALDTCLNSTPFLRGLD